MKVSLNLNITDEQLLEIVKMYDEEYGFLDTYPERVLEEIIDFVLPLNNNKSELIPSINASDRQELIKAFASTYIQFMRDTFAENLGVSVS